MARRKRSAFTFLELLLAITLIAALAILLFSLEKRMRHSANKVHNIGNLRTIGIAVFSYAADHHGEIPGNTPGGISTRTIGTGMTSGTAVRKLFGKQNFSPIGQGNSDYLKTPDTLYGPFTPIFRNRPPNGFYSSQTGAYQSGYTVYNLPRIDGKGNAPILEGCFNDRLTENPHAPIYSDWVNWDEFTGSEISVLFLDGSIRNFSKEEVAQYPDQKARLKLFSGIK